MKHDLIATLRAAPRRAWAIPDGYEAHVMALITHAMNGDWPEPEAAVRRFPGARGAKSTAVVSMKGAAFYDLEFQPFVF